MKFTILLTSIFSTSITLASSFNSALCTPVEAVYTIESFTTRRYDGQTINTVSFIIKSADGGSLDFTCVAYDSAKGQPTELFESGKVYPCGLNSSFSFSYTPNAGEIVDDLYLWQEISGIETWGGGMTPASAICRAGGNGVSDLICVVPAIGNAYVEMEKLGD